jgi:hypothetical protein
MFAFPLFVLVNELDPSGGRDLLSFVTWCFTIGGLILSYLAAARYIPMARTALREGREARDTHGAPA